MSLFESALFLTFTPAERDILERPVDGPSGGHQILLRAILDGYSRKTGLLVIEPAQLRKADKLAYAYGGGGYQVRFRTLVSAARRQGWTE